MRVTAYILDDERQARENLSGALKRFCPEVRLLGESGTIDKALADIIHLEPDLLFLDVELKDRLVFELVEQLEARPQIVFVTGHDRYALNAIKVEALDYLIKPIVPKDLMGAVSKARQAVENQALLGKLKSLVQNDGEQRLSIPGKDKYRITNINDLIYCESDNNYTRFHLNDGEVVLVSKTLKSFESQLPNAHFFRIHQSFLVNLSFVISFDRKESELLLANGSLLPVAQRRKAELIKKLNF
ncbi:MAG: response regulator transcription factor [Roseivirga sp.]|nr:response regulator transcription factor [Roseivirga sp.]